MFGQYFNRSYPFPSFNVRDLDTLDTETFKKMDEEISKGDFDFMIGHVIGIDHAGHTFGANHLETERKLLETEKAIQRIINKMDSNTVLIVFGDHGMTNEGNHGGGT